MHRGLVDIVHVLDTTIQTRLFVLADLDALIVHAFGRAELCQPQHGGADDPGRLIYAGFLKLFPVFRVARTLKLERA